MHVSVTFLREKGKRLSAWKVRTQTPAVGWLQYQFEDRGHGQRLHVVRLVREDGREIMGMEHAQLVAARGPQGALIAGVEYRAKGRKHSISDRQEWWIEAPPRLHPLVDNKAAIAEIERRLAAQEAAMWPG